MDADDDGLLGLGVARTWEADELLRPLVQRNVRVAAIVAIRIVELNHVLARGGYMDARERE